MPPAGSGRYWIMRAVDDPNHVMIDLEFDSTSEPAGLVEGPQARIVETVETVAY